MAGTWTITSGNHEQASTHEAFLLGQDEHGRWLFVPAGGPDATDRVQLISEGAGWTASWSTDGAVTTSLTTPVEIAGSSVRYDEIGSGPRVGPDGVVDPGGAAGAELTATITAGAEPFGEVGPTWVVRIRRNALNFRAYDPTWPARFAAARDELAPLVPGSRIEHIGSTAVPGLAAKDVIDIALIVPDRAGFDRAADAVADLGYLVRPAAFADDPGHVFFRRVDDGRRTHHLHLYLDGTADVARVLAFRDRLRTDAGARRRYEQVKTALAADHPYDLMGYAAGKDDVVAELLSR